MFQRLLPIALIALALPLHAAAPTDEQQAVAAGAVRLTADELRGLYLGHTVVGTKPSGYVYRIPVHADGTIPESPKRGVGKVTVEEDGRACMSFAKLFEGKPRCWTHYRIGERIVDFNGDGSKGSEKRFEPLP